ncbi:MAG: hypothetical protein K2X47_04390, partial [Bdellovibrionales bacterium]|nr:hypothetical protein [Bdellovibrionales bacterium]
EDGVKSAFGLAFYKINYETKDPHGVMVPVSGLMIVPRWTFRRDFSMIAYHHGTTTHKNAVPSNTKDRETILIGLIFGLAGYVVVAPDYIGLGDSPGLHPFLHVETQAGATIDLIEEAKTIAAKEGIRLNGQLFLTGYSQGGHAAMSTHWLLEKNLSFFNRVMNRSSVTASSPMAGPYDLSDSSVVGALTSPSDNTSAYVSYLTLAMNDVYRIYSNLREMYLPPFDSRIPQLLDGTRTLSEVAAALPPIPQQFLQPHFVHGVLTNPNHPFREALALNNVYNWRPRAPVRLSAGRADKDVPFVNSEIAYTTMRALGATVDLVNVGNNLDHRGAILPAMLGTRKWFDQLRSRRQKNPVVSSGINFIRDIHPLLGL